MAEFEGYTPIFELGLCEDNPAVLVLEDASIQPVALAALVTALFETVMNTVPDDEQIAYENNFKKSLKVLMRERFNYDVERRFLDDD